MTARNPDAVARFANAPLENIPDPQIASHLLDIDSSALERVRLLWGMQRILNTQGTARIRQLVWFERAIALDPQFALANAALAATLNTRKSWGWSADPAADSSQALMYSKRAYHVRT